MTDRISTSTYAVVLASLLGLPAAAVASTGLLDSPLIDGILVLGLTALASGWLTYRARLRRRLRDIQDQAWMALDKADLARKSSPGGDSLAHLSDAVCQLSAAFVDERQRWREEMARRSQTEERLRESEERYALAVRGANDGMWEWDIKANRVHYSPRWKGMLGFAESDLGPHLEEWTDRLHPDDRPHVLAELTSHLEGRAARFENEHRLRHRDGSYRWVLARATAVRHVSGRAYRLIGLITDISARKRVQEALLELAEGLSAVQGEDCFRTLVRTFATVLGVREAFLCECIDSPASRLRMLARWKGGEFARCVEFDVEGTACQEVIADGKTVYWPHNAGERWPLERTFDREAYLGIPCHDSQGHVIGHIACADPVSMPDELPHQAILKIFAVRASIELERRRLEHERLAVGVRAAPTPTSLH